jgi:DNA-binding HxlR family transcriptional regulator
VISWDLSKRKDSTLSTLKSRADKSGCPISYSLDIFGDRWTLLVLRDLILHGKTRFHEFLASEEGIASNILSDRLQRLECLGIIQRERDPEDGRQKFCRVTEKGLSLTPILLEIAAWGASNDEKTAAPKAFPDAYYADREAYHQDHRRLITELFEAEGRESH